MSLYLFAGFDILLMIAMITPTNAMNKPCSNVREPVLNICETGSVKHDINQNNVALLVNSERNCTCKLFFTNQTREQEVVFKRFNDYVSSDPQKNNCGLKIDIIHNGDRFHSIECQLNTIYRNISRNDELLIKSVTSYGTLPENSGYCMEIMKEDESVSNENVLNLQCGLNSEIETSSISSALSVSATSSRSMSSSISLPSQKQTMLEESTNLSIEPSTITWAYSTFTRVVDVLSSNLTPKQVVIEDSKEVTYVAIGTSVSFLVISVVIAVIIVICKTKRCHSKQLRLQTTEHTGNLSEVCGQDNSVDCELQYNVLYNMPSRVDHRNEENTIRPNAVENLASGSSEYKYSTVNFECNDSGVGDKIGHYSTIDMENIPHSLKDGMETPYQTVSEATDKNDFPADEETTPTFDLRRRNHDDTASTEGISNNNIRRNEGNPHRINSVNAMPNEYKQSVVNFECHYGAVDNMGGDYSTNDMENVPHNLKDDKEAPYRTVSDDLPADEETTPTIDLGRSNHDDTDSTKGIFYNDNHVYAVPDKRRIEHINGPSGSLYTVVKKFGGIHYQNSNVELEGRSRVT